MSSPLSKSGGGNTPSYESPRSSSGTKDFSQMSTLQQAISKLGVLWKTPESASPIVTNVLSARENGSDADPEYQFQMKSTACNTDIRSEFGLQDPAWAAGLWPNSHRVEDIVRNAETIHQLQSRLIRELSEKIADTVIKSENKDPKWSKALDNTNKQYRFKQNLINNPSIETKDFVHSEIARSMEDVWAADKTIDKLLTYFSFESGVSEVSEVGGRLELLVSRSDKGDFICKEVNIKPEFKIEVDWPDDPTEGPTAAENFLKVSQSCLGGFTRSES
ncbi:uncharacterized protein I206_100005 [Kwoniella pini CBS 10737]|uniref:Uncharacterized protein n=1 Tax=Kwoniella pini CBS 10737 TaxID=1296096 RepID=A0A1B9HS89_9TREE|nr:uncharacterized protein I206_07820 [Kwoniella pini CBS 10737]OCF46150.1 hypothetical protein I206_07820 [Kwoniella pini CBS 10737]